MPRSIEDLADEMVKCVLNCQLSGAELDEYVHAFMSDGPEDAEAMLLAIGVHRCALPTFEQMVLDDNYNEIEASIRRWQATR